MMKDMLKSFDYVFHATLNGLLLLQLYKIL